jgi:hypothetical protein
MEIVLGDRSEAPELIALGSNRKQKKKARMKSIGSIRLIKYH